jgi:biopolymer transport protein ExbB/TolQ
MTTTAKSERRDVANWIVLMLIVLIVVLGVLVSFSISRSYKVEKAAKAATAASIQASQSADAAKAALEEAIARGQNPKLAQETQHAIESIGRIERHLCGGPCPQ